MSVFFSTIRLSRIVLLLAAVIAGACTDPYASLPEQRVMVLGVDGMDYAMTARLMAAGRMPNFSRLSKPNGFQPLATSVPPLSPVAWSDFMTGMDSGGHGIFDFLHRHPERMLPEFSMSKTEPADSHLTLGSWQLPLDSGRVINLRQGEVFWHKLAEYGVRSTIIRMPANYPPVGIAERELAGMGTPDLRGTYGVFTFITTKFAAAARPLDGGEIQEVWEEDGIIRAVLKGPPNPFRVASVSEPLERPLEISRSAGRNQVVLQIGDQNRVLNPGKWSSWVPVDFKMIPFWPAASGSLHGMVRFYLRTAFPDLELYVSPINFDPLNPDTVLSKPASFVTELAEATGRFYTQGLPEDTKAFEEGVLTLEEFMSQARQSSADTLAQLDLLVTDFLQDRRSFLFYYLGHLDQVSHVLWKSTDPQHPAYDPQIDPKWAAELESLYVEIDTLVGRLADQIGTRGNLVVMSDHGFAPWRRAMELNGWLHEQNYLALKSDKNEGQELFADVDWGRTKAYGLGLNGLYLNLAGREKNGIVTVAERAGLLDQLRQALLSVIDPGTGLPAVTQVYRADQHYTDQGALKHGPDLIVGYRYGTRVSSRSALGAVAGNGRYFSDHLAQWSGDHAMDHRTVPGILLTKQPLLHPVENIRDLATALVAEFTPEVSDSQTTSEQ